MNQDGSNPVNISNDPAAGDETPHWSPDGKKIVFVSLRDSNNGGSSGSYVYVMDTDPNTDDATNLTNTPENEFSPAFSPDGKKIVFEDFQSVAGRGEIFTMNPDGSDPTNLTNSILGEDLTPAFSPNGKKIAFDSDRDGSKDIFVMNADGTGQTNLNKLSSASDAQPDWQPLKKR